LDPLNKEDNDGGIREFPDTKLLTPEDDVLKKEVAEEYERIKNSLYEAMTELPPRDQLLLKLKFQQGKSAAEIGGIMSLSQRKVYSLIGRDLKKLKQCLEESGYDERVVLDVLGGIDMHKPLPFD